MSEEVKDEILKAWNRYLYVQHQRYQKNEGSSQQHADTHRLFKQGIANHAKLSKKEKEELLGRISSQPA